jgi:hypothetical protein
MSQDKPMTLSFTWTMDIGAEGVDDDPNNPFSRALERLLQTAKPFEKLSLCFTALPDAPQGTESVRWLGAFAFSAGERVLVVS